MDIILEDGEVRAQFSPERGMNLKSLRFGEIEVIDQSTASLFDERSAGLGAMIGPHFHRRKVVPKFDLSSFKHVDASLSDPFSHGIGRYAPWTFEAGKNRITAVLKGSDVWNGIKLCDLEGQDFTMTYKAAIVDGGLNIELGVVSQGDSLVGIHFYYHVPGKGQVVSCVKDSYINASVMEPIPSSLGYDPLSHLLKFPLDKEADFTFHPFLNPLKGDIALETEKYTLITRYESTSAENSWQLWRPKGSFVCIEPISAWDPRHANLTVSGVKIRLSLR
jgi:hypothetical protein